MGDKIRAIVTSVCLLGALLLIVAGYFFPLSSVLAQEWDPEPDCTYTGTCPGYLLCCEGTCYDPYTHWCDCEGNVIESGEEEI